MASFGEGNAVVDLLWVIGVIILLGVVWLVMGGPVRFGQLGGTASSSSLFSIPNIVPGANDAPVTSVTAPARNFSDRQSPSNNSVPADPTKSRYAGQVSLRLGRSDDSANRDYAILQAGYGNEQAIDITGWKIDNGGNKVVSEVNGQPVRGNSLVITIPKGTTFLTGKNPSRLQSIKLAPGGQANVISGGITQSSPYSIDTSFLVNKCSGYLSYLPGYQFEPALYSACPSYDSEIGNLAVARDCEDQIKYRYGSNCRTPVETTDTQKGLLIDGQTLTQSCRATVLKVFNYTACLARHSTDADFETKTWYIYLRRTWGIYYPRNATITLYDNLGKVVDKYSY